MQVRQSPFYNVVPWSGPVALSIRNTGGTVASVAPVVQTASSSSLPVLMGDSSWMTPIAGLATESWQGLRGMLTGLSQMTGSLMQGPSIAPAWEVSMPQLTMPALMSFGGPMSFSQVANDMGQGARRALSTLGGMLVDNAPAVLTFAGTMAATTAVCSFMGGTMAATGAIMLGQHLMNGQQNPHAP